MKLSAISAAAATGIQVGAAIVASRFVLDQVGPASLALLRYVIGFLCLLPFLFTHKHQLFRFAKGDLLPIAAIGIIQFGLLIALLNYALQLISAARAALIFASLPLLAMLLAAAFRLERLNTLKTLGVLLTIVGVALSLGEKALNSSFNPQSNWIGELAAFGSAFCGAVCSILYRPYLTKYPALPISAFAMLASIGFLALLAGGEGLFHHPFQITPIGWSAILFIGASSGIGYFLWLWALANGTPTQVTVFLSLSPVTAACLGTWLLGEPITWDLIGGLACIAAGLWFALWHRGIA